VHVKPILITKSIQEELAMHLDKEHDLTRVREYVANETAKFSESAKKPWLIEIFRPPQVIFTYRS